MSAPDPVTVTPELLRSRPLPGIEDDKDATGRALVAGGSAGTPGAVLLAAYGCLRAGAGKLQLAVGESVAVALAVAMPEALVIALPETPGGDLDPAAAAALSGPAGACSALLLGVGALDDESAARLVERVLPAVASGQGRVLLDAAAIGVATSAPAALRPVASRTLLTPNRKELAGALGKDAERVGADPGAAAIDLAARTDAVVAAGGATTHVADAAGSLWVVEAGGPNLAVSGSGDAQAGIMLGLLARGASPVDAALWGAWVHGRCGELLAQDVGPVGGLARELSAYVPRVLAEVADRAD